MSLLSFRFYLTHFDLNFCLLKPSFAVVVVAHKVYSVGLLLNTV